MSFPPTARPNRSVCPRDVSEQEMLPPAWAAPKQDTNPTWLPREGRPSPRLPSGRSWAAEAPHVTYIDDDSQFPNASENIVPDSWGEREAPCRAGSAPGCQDPRLAGERDRLGPLPGGQMCGTSGCSRARREGILANDSASATPSSAGVQSQTVTSPRGASNQLLPEWFCSPSPEPETSDEVPRGTKIPFGCSSCPKRSTQERGGFRVLHRCSGTGRPYSGMGP